MYNTKQKDILLAFFKKHSGQNFTSAEIISNPEIDMGEATVYRNLSVLSKNGKLNKFIEEDENFPRYQYNEQCECNHFHLKCSNCGKIFHTECEFFHDMEHHLKSDHNFQVDNKKTVIYGLCGNCRKDK